MKYLRQFTIILLISCLGEVCHALLPMPIPASIYGMVLLFAALMTGLIKLDQVKETGQYLVSIMSVLFVCPAVGLLKYWDVLRENLLAVAVILVVSLVLTFFVAGRVTQWAMKRGGRKDD